jgi:RES domain-containing protein
MARAWRIVKKIHAPSAFDGEGAWRFGGRWNSPGTRVVYCSANLSLAALENLVHLNPPVAFKSVAIELEFDERLIETIGAKSLPPDWTEEPPAVSTMRLGDRWVRERCSAVLKLPSAIIPTESNYLLNPAHRDFQKIIIRKPVAFSFDPRLL